MRIRKYKSGDNKRISNLIRKCLIEINSADYTAKQIKFIWKEVSPSKVHIKFASRNSYVAVEDNKIIGCFTFKDGEIGNVFVNPRFHSQGIGRKLMAKAEKVASQLGFLSVWVNSSITAVSFYKKLNYKKKTNVSHKDGGETFVMKKQLPK